MLWLCRIKLCSSDNYYQRKIGKVELIDDSRKTYFEVLLCVDDVCFSSYSNNLEIGKTYFCLLHILVVADKLLKFIILSEKQMLPSYNFQSHINS